MDTEHKKYTQIIHQASGLDINHTMKAIHICFEIQHPEHITLMKAFIGHWDSNLAIIVKMPNLQ